MKTILFLIITTISSNLFASDDKSCESVDYCKDLNPKVQEFKHPEVTSEQIDNAYTMAEDVLGDIGRSIAGEIVEE